MAQVRLARVIPSMHVHLCVASWLFSPRLSLFSTSSHRSPSSPSRCSPQCSTRGPGPTPCATSAWGPWPPPTTRHPSQFEEGIKTLQDSDINLLTIDDVPGWMLMRKASLTQERRERLIAALPDEHFAIDDVKRVLVRIFPELHIDEHRESDGYSRRPRNDHTGSSSAYQRREQTSYPRRYRSTLATVGRHR